MSEHVVRISTGFIKGLMKTTVLNTKKYYSFQGIPYAEPPVGKNRFKDPLPCKPWDGVLDATKVGNACAQFSELQKCIIGNEDCLFLNVYTPNLPDENSTINNSSLLPVMVYIHGGAFTTSSASDDRFGPDYLVEHDVIIVTINYRVGVFGFLSLGNSDVPGNAGLKDQSLALKWVQENIKWFGGNNNNVTLFGQSAGAASVHYHALSTLSAGTFHKVIMQSGNALCPWAFCDNPVSRALRLGEVLGKKTDDVFELAEFLRNQSSDTLVNNQGKILTVFEKKTAGFPFLPCKEVSGTGMNFITEDPSTLSESGKFAKVPCIIGVTDREGLIVFKEIKKLEQRLEEVQNDSIKFVPLDFCNENEINENIAKKVKNFYFSNMPLSIQTLPEFADLCSDINFTIGVNKFLKDLPLTNEIPVYVYLFSYEGKLGYSKYYVKACVKHIPEGASHGDELGYIFHCTKLFKELPVEKNSAEVKVIDAICTLWSNFSKNSDPNDENFTVKWKHYSSNQPTYLDIGESLNSVDSVLFPKRTEFWNQVYESKK